MTRARSPDREKARLMWLQSGKTLKLKEIAEKLENQSILFQGGNVKTAGAIKNRRKNKQ